MIDYLKTKIAIPNKQIPNEVFNHETKPFTWNGLDFFPKDEYSYKATKGSLKRQYLEGFNVTITDGQAANLNIVNSLHKYYCNGINHNDFCRSDLINSITMVSDSLGLDFGNANVFGRLEYAVNIQTANAEKCYTSQMRYSNYIPKPMTKNDTQYGTSFNTKSGLGIKSYSPFKKLEIMRDSPKEEIQNILRFEGFAQTSYLRKNAISIYKVKDLIKDDVLDVLGERLYTTAKKIKLVPQLPNDVGFDEQQKFYFFQKAPRQEIERFRKEKRATYYRHKKVYEDLLKKHLQKDIDISPLVKQKWCDLMAS